ncbi:MAG: DUF6686 family protein [Bacteroidota bacterium]
MCLSLKVLNQTKNGCFTFCNHSKLFQLVFNNLCFEFYEWELEAFKSYLSGLDVEYWENEMKCTPHQRKIPISVGNKHFIILVNKRELHEIQDLVSTKPQENPRPLHHKDIDYTYIEN